MHQLVFSRAVTDELWPFRHCTCLKAQTPLTSVSDYNRHAWKCGATQPWNSLLYWKSREGEVKVRSANCWPTSFTHCFFPGFYFQSCTRARGYLHSTRRHFVHTRLHKRSQNRSKCDVGVGLLNAMPSSVAAVPCLSDLWISTVTRAQWWLGVRKESICSVAESKFVKIT